MVPTEIFEIELTSLQFRFLSNFIRISKINNGHSFFGYPNLAEINQCGRAAACRRHEVHPLLHLDCFAVWRTAPERRCPDHLVDILQIWYRDCTRAGTAYCGDHRNRAEQFRASDTPILPAEKRRKEKNEMIKTKNL